MLNQKLADHVSTDARTGLCYRKELEQRAHELGENQKLHGDIRRRRVATKDQVIRLASCLDGEVSRALVSRSSDIDIWVQPGADNADAILPQVATTFLPHEG